MTDNPAPEPHDLTIKERHRIGQISKIAGAARAPEELLLEHVGKGTAIEAFKAAVLDWKVESQPDYGQPQWNINATASDPNYYRNVTSRGMTDFEAPGFVMSEATSYHVDRLKGQRPTGKFAHITDPRAMFDTGSKWLQPRAAGMLTTGDLNASMEQAANIVLQDLMKAADGGISLVALNSTFKDFRTNAEIAMSGFPELNKVEEGAEIQFGTIGDTKETWAGASYARMINISFQAQTNDVWGAIMRSLRDISIATVQLKNGLLVSALLKVMADGNALYHALHSNLAATGAILSVATLGAGRAAMRVQKATGSTAPLGVAPRYILVPATLETDAEKLVSDIQAGTSDNANPFSGKLIVAAEPRLTGTAWHLFADPAVWPVLKFATLEGYEAPRLEFEEMFSNLGTSYRVHWHVAATAIDTRGTWKNPGA